jgi:flagellar hook-basal body protein
VVCQKKAWPKHKEACKAAEKLKKAYEDDHGISTAEEMDAKLREAKQLSDLGDARAQYRLGTAYLNGLGVEIDKEGFISAIFNNGVTRQIYKLPVATFVNPDGLFADRGGVYRATADSGAFSLKDPGLGGAGVIDSFSLETSSVDLAQEFSSMIIIQRAYSASSKIITTADDMLDEVIRMKR